MNLADCNALIDAKAAQLGMTTPYGARDLSTTFRAEAQRLVEQGFGDRLERLVPMMEPFLKAALASGGGRYGVPAGLADLLMNPDGLPRPAGRAEGGG